MQGEYAISRILLEMNYNIDSLLMRYRGIDWRDQTSWMCNDNIHPSRIGMYDEMSQHPLETVFIKASWGVGEPYTSKYSKWIYLQHTGRNYALTHGTLNLTGYQEGISATKSSLPGDLDLQNMILS